MSRRAERMARRLERDALRQGVADAAVADLVAAFRLAMERRLELDDHHPDHLHTARTVLILLEDARVTNRTILCAAALCETRNRSLTVDRDRVESRLGADVRRLLAAIPDPGDGQTPADRSGPDPDRAGAGLLEALVTAPPGAALVAVAERLDHARHLHLRPEAEWRPYHARSCEVYAPVALRINDVLGDRLAWWCETFRERYLMTA